jgi:Spy/CpxP family protein refolding chaperone
MKTKIVIAFVGLALLAGTLFAQQARRFGGFGFGMGGPRMAMLAGYLDLSDAQKSNLQSLMVQGREEAKPLLEQLKSGHDQVAAAVKAGKSEGEVAALAESQGAVMGKLAALHARNITRFYAQLTPEQKQKAEELHNQMRERMRSRMEAHRAEKGL